MGSSIRGSKPFHGPSALSKSLELAFELQHGPPCSLLSGTVRRRPPFSSRPVSLGSSRGSCFPRLALISETLIIWPTDQEQR